MKIKEISKLTEEELAFFKESELYRRATAYYTYCDIHKAYYEEYFQFGKIWTEDLSLLVYDNKNCYICMFMYTNGIELSFFGSPIEVFSISGIPVQEEGKAYKEIFLKIDEFRNLYGFSKMKFFDQPQFLANYYGSDNFKSEISYWNRIDLSLSEEAIYMNVRKSYKSLINWGKKNLEIKIFNQENITPELIEQFENFHIEVAKRRTRSSKSWKLQYDAIHQGKGYVVYGYMDGILVSAILILNGHEECYYGVAVSRRDLMSENLPLGHALLLTAISEAKRIGLKFFNMGDVTMHEDSKLNAIAKYKRGFSSSLVTRNKFEVNWFSNE